LDKEKIRASRYLAADLQDICGFAESRQNFCVCDILILLTTMIVRSGYDFLYVKGVVHDALFGCEEGESDWVGRYGEVTGVV
jgi:hypothetical protein